jgi:VanZ family protein
MKTPELPDTFDRFLAQDKLAHAGVYFVLTGLLGWAFHRNGGHRVLLSAGIAALYGVGMEIVQYAFFPHRYFELLDIIANIIGSIAGLFALKFFLK